MIEAKNYLILSLIVALLAALFTAIIVKAGFAVDWSWLRTMMFFLLSFVYPTSVLAGLLFFYSRQQKNK